MLELIPFKDEDKELYLKTQIEAFKKYVIEFYGTFDIKIMEDHLSQLKDNLYKIVNDGKECGFVYFKEDRDKIIVDVFCLFKDQRNNGLGSCIMKSFIEKSKKLNKPIFLDTFKTNPAQNFYKKHGFKIVGENHSHYILKYDPNSH